jgi:hypothetical protein
MIAKHILTAVHEIGLMAGISIIWIAKVNAQAIYPPIGTPLPDPPQVVSPFELRAINDPATGKGAFELHPFHIHQVHFLVYQENGKKAERPEWLDTVNLTPEGFVHLIMDYTDPIASGMSVFLCHLLKHKDKGIDGEDSLSMIRFTCRLAKPSASYAGSFQYRFRVIVSSRELSDSEGLHYLNPTL